METIHILMTGITAIILFVFGLENFSREIEQLSGERFRKYLGNVTNKPVIGVLIGAAVTAVIQSSSATSVITISLVNAGVLSFKNSVGIIFGSNIGTTVTSQLVAFKLTSFAPLFIILGFILSLIRSRYSVFGKAIFYFGFVFFSLNLISSSLQPLQGNPFLMKFLMEPQNPFMAILFGCVFTALVQSSSVTTGLAIIFTQQGLLGLENAVPIIMGANIGTTATGYIAVFTMDTSAKKTALSHLLFNISGVIIFTPLLLVFGSRLNSITMDPAIALANIHLVFNVATSIIFIILIVPFTRLVDRMLGEGKMDFERITLPPFEKEQEFTAIKQELDEDIDELFAFLQENYNVVTLSIETNYSGISEIARKRIDYFDYIKKEYLGFFSHIVTIVKDEDDSRELLQLINQFDYLFQIHDSINDLFNARKVMTTNYIELKSDVLLMVRDLASNTLNLFGDIQKFLQGNTETNIQKSSFQLQSHLKDAYRSLLPLLTDSNRRDASALTNFITYNQRLKDKLINFHELHKDNQETEKEKQ